MAANMITVIGLGGVPRFRVYSMSSVDKRRRRFASPRSFFSDTLAALALAPGRVRLRTTGGTRAFWIKESSLFSASWRFCSWVRYRPASIIRIPSSVTFFPAILISRAFTSALRDGELRTSNLSWTVVATLFTFCPPGPEDRMKSNWISLRTILLKELSLSISLVYQAHKKVGHVEHRFIQLDKRRSIVYIYTHTTIHYG